MKSQSPVPRDANSPTPSTTKMVEFAEEQAALLRLRAGVDPESRFDPRILAHDLKLEIITPSDVANALPEDRVLLASVDVKTWSGMGKTLPDGRLLVMLHPNQTVERANITVMEEVAHAHLGHRFSRLTTQSNGLEKRQYNQTDEQEAYWTAAATLLPRLVVARTVWWEQPIESLISAYGVSKECIEFRIKILKLWKDYQRYAVHRCHQGVA